MCVSILFRLQFNLIILWKVFPLTDFTLGFRLAKTTTNKMQQNAAKNA